MLYNTERDIVLAIPSVRPMPVLCLNEYTYRHIFGRSGRRIILVFLSPTAVTKFQE